MAYKIMLACAGGFSTSMLVTQMNKAAEKKGIEVEIDAVSESALDNYEDLDIILLGPQVGHIKDELKKSFSIPITVISQMDYGMMNGEKVLNEALELLEK
ncbi:PTS sugar transporter subunit IIB [Tetragenococcus koreensis]|uniref:PTS sugar transporter subunit IIB n=1 Tax=Tetragenococcus koreensis TaxID=290335 RepID=UPI000F4F7F17|nr:PTS sugar transporter subunit IIB [Tetragenococcus koreensis]AYW44827.1 PTS sugar transporter subunit IIB [Tetragenococcus koreensis]GEN90398.1 PTS sugar transporter subunit IIB [Tetragenococcus koreensis]